MTADPLSASRPIRCHMPSSLADLKILALDCQATGANPAKGHLLEIGWMPFGAALRHEDRRSAVQSYLIRLPADAKIPRAVQRLTGITEKSPTAALAAEIVWRHLMETVTEVRAADPVAGCPTVIHFARYEEPFLRDLHKKNEPDRPFPFQIICTHEIAVRLLPNLPRRGIRAVAGYFGHGMPELKRSADHVVATAFIWQKMIELLASQCQITTHEQLSDWLTAKNFRGCRSRNFPMPPENVRHLPDKPGIYRMRRANHDLLYIGKAKSLKRRVNSYFRPKAPHAEHTLEMLTQARKLDFTPTGSALEAAVLESDEIKRHSPPYNIALRRRQRTLVFCSKDLCRHSTDADRDCPIGPLPGGSLIEAVTAFGRWLINGLQKIADDDFRFGSTLLAVPPEYAPDIQCCTEGLDRFRENHRGLLASRVPLRVLTGLGAQKWRERLEKQALAGTPIESETIDAEADEDPHPPEAEFVWTPEAVVTGIETMLTRSAHLMRRARWFCMLSESALAWATAEDPDHPKIVVIFNNGTVFKRYELAAGAEPPAPPGYGTSFHARQKNLDLSTYDRLRVVTTELRRLISAGRNIELRLGPNVRLHRHQLQKVLQWV